MNYRDQPWHKECFVCIGCKGQLAGQRFTSRDDFVYCLNCFCNLFAKKCASCTCPISGNVNLTIKVWEDWWIFAAVALISCEDGNRIDRFQCHLASSARVFSVHRPRRRIVWQRLCPLAHSRLFPQVWAAASTSRLSSASGTTTASTANIAASPWWAEGSWHPRTTSSVPTAAKNSNNW